MVTKKVSALKVWDKNPKNISKKGFDRLLDEMKLGQHSTLLVMPDGTVLGGNQRLRAMKELGIEEAKCIEVDLNFYELETIQEQLDKLGLEEEEVVEDDPPEVSKEPAKSKLGEVYTLGRHRLMCGDATKIEDVEKLMNGRKADMVFTDPPYGVGYDGGAKKRDGLIGDEVGNDVYLPSLMISKEFVKPDASLYLWYADANISAAAAAAAAADWIVTAQIIWVKNNAQFVSSAHYHGKHEPCLYAHRKGKSAQWYGNNNEVTVWDVDRSNKNEYHPTQKPVALSVRACKNSTKEGGLVLDLFGGSGSTLIACEQTNRTCYMMEIDAHYCDVIRKRYAKFIEKEEDWEAITSPPLSPIDAKGSRGEAQ